MEQETNPQHEKLIAEITAWANNKEAECLDRVLNRLCWLKGWPVDIKHVNCVKKTGWPETYYELWYTYKEQIFLMSRDFKIIDDKPVLEITFNKELLNE